MNQMIKIQKCFYNSFKSKNLFLFVAAMMAFAMFHRPLEILLSNTLVEYVFCFPEKTWYNDVTFIFIASCFVIFVVKKFGDYVPSQRFLWILIFINLVYLNYRVTGEPWVFTSFAYVSILKYFDILILLLICYLVLFIKKGTVPYSNPDISFVDESPIISGDDDQFGYWGYANRVAQRILASRFDKSFAIGINGRWGFGKTSMLNLIKKNISNEVINIEFHPWNSSSSDAIVIDFFDVVQDALKPFHFSLSRLLNRYANKLSAINNNGLALSIQTVFFGKIESDSISKLKNEIEKSLERISKKVVIYIDDLDRLDKLEIIEVIRLIRNTASFPNTFFVVAYDRNYIIAALRKHNFYKHEMFLEKIFQLEINLPYFNNEIFKKNFVELLKSKFPTDVHEIIEDGVFGTFARSPCLDKTLIRSMRDVIRLVNSVALNLKGIFKEVDFCDFIRMESFRIKYPSIYEILYRCTLDFFEVYSNRSEKYQYVLKKITKGKAMDSESNSIEGNYYLEYYLNQNFLHHSIAKNEIPQIVAFIENVFNTREPMSWNAHSFLSIANPSMFTRYFSYALMEGDFSDIDFSVARNKSQEEFNADIKRFISKGFEQQLTDRFEDVKVFDSKNDYEKVITAIFYFANLPSKVFPLKIDYPKKNLRNKLDKNSDSVKMYYGANDGLHEFKFKRFVSDLLNNPNSSHEFESVFLGDILELNDNSLPLTLEEVLQINEGYLRAYCEKVDMFDSRVWQYFKQCQLFSYTKEGGSYKKSEGYYSEETKQIINNFIFEKDLDGFLFKIIEINQRENNSFGIHMVVLKIFGSWASFEKKLSLPMLIKSEYLNEFKQFFVLIAERKFQGYIDFKFQTIPIHKKII
jgi:predicted KAP-like P-loop ATPase